MYAVLRKGIGCLWVSPEETVNTNITGSIAILIFRPGDAEYE